MTDLSLYLHIPFCRRRCSYCSFVSTSGREAEIPAYIRALKSEIALSRRKEAEVKTIYFGGGTPGLLSPTQIGELLTAVRSSYAIREDAEITLEANPGTVGYEYLSGFQEAGVNRLSLGIQSLDDSELKFLGRLHNAEEAIHTVRDARRAGFENLSLDFIYGVPGRSEEKWQELLKGITDLEADHLSLYALTLEEGTPLAEAVARGEAAAPDPDAAARDYEMACEALEAAGYRQYEISNWARPGRESRHNTVYWTGGAYLGLGCGAHSFLDGTRRANPASLDEYLSALGKGRLPEQSLDPINPATALSEAIILGLRLNAGVSPDDIKARFGIDLLECYSTEIAELRDLGLMKVNTGRLKLTPRGRLLGNEVFIRFLPD